MPSSPQEIDTLIQPTHTRVALCLFLLLGMIGEWRKFKTQNCFFGMFIRWYLKRLDTKMLSQSVCQYPQWSIKLYFSWQEWRWNAVFKQAQYYLHNEFFLHTFTYVIPLHVYVRALREELLTTSCKLQHHITSCSCYVVDKLGFTFIQIANTPL